MAQDVKVCNVSSELDEGRVRLTYVEFTVVPQNEDYTNAECRRLQDLDRAMAVLGLTPEQQSLFLRIAQSTDTLDKLAKCVAPDVRPS